MNVPLNAHGRERSDFEMSGELKFADMRTFIRRNRKMMAGVIGTILLVGLPIILLIPRTYTASASFVPQGAGSAGGQLSGLAQQFGLSVPSEGYLESPPFYVDLLESRRILGSVVEGEYRTGPDRRPVPFPELVEANASTPVARREKAMRKLRDMVDASFSRETGLVRIRVKSRWADLSEAITQRMLALVQDFNSTVRQSQAAAERRFAEERLARVTEELEIAEAELQDFLRQNRRIQNSPELLFENERLERAVAMRQQLVTSLALSVEQAKIEEVRNTPVITVVNPVEAPALPDRRGRILKGMLLLVTACIVGVVAALGRELWLGWSSG